jgi:uncharacterized membrane protein YecN with MAPEG domain
MPVCTALWASVLGMMVVVMGLRVSGARLRRVAEEPLRRLVRVHGNLTENAPIFLVMLLVAELCAAPPPALHALGGAFVTARLLHAVGLGASLGRSRPRFAGMALTWTIMLATAALDAWLFVGASL